MMNKKSDIKFEQLSNAEHFRRNKEQAGLDNQIKAGYTTVRELVENGLDSSEMLRNVRPNIQVSIDNVDDMYHKILIKDNGIGVSPEHIPNAFARIFYGSKFVIRQSRGIMGAGGKLVCQHGFVTTTKPYRIISATPDSKFIYVFDLGVDLNKGEPITFNQSKEENKNNWHGTIVRLYTKIDLKCIKKIIHYLRLTVLAMPYVSFKFTVNGQTLYEHKGNKNIKIPERAYEVKIHPHGADTHDIQKLIEKEVSKHGKDNGNLILSKFMVRNFQSVGYKSAEDFLKFSELSPNKNISNLDHIELMRFVDKLSKFEGFRLPTTDCLSLLTEDNITAGLKERYNPDFITYVTKNDVYSGHAFVIELALAIGGTIKQPKHEYGFKIYRFANKMPLLYDQRACSLYKNIIETNFKKYNIEPNMQILIFVHICSTRVPYKTIGKEYISADNPEINRTVKLAINEALRKTSVYLSNINHAQAIKERQNRFLTYIPHIAENLAQIVDKPKEELETLMKKVLKLNGET